MATVIYNNKQSVNNNSIENNVKPEDLICPICCSTFMEPVLLPCRHRFCLTCINESIKFNSLTCPCCRKRFATWLRKVKDPENLIDQELWNYIKNNCANFVKTDSEKKNKNCKDSSTAKAATQTTTTAVVDAAEVILHDISSVTAAQNQIKISQPGEIRKEYEEQLQAFYEQIKIEKENELKATSKYIIDLFKKESQALEASEVKQSKEIMLVANPGHTPYSLTTNKKNYSSKPTFTKTSADDVKSSTSTSSQLVQNLKSISVRINRGSEILKQTVQSAVLSKLPTKFFFGKGLLTVPPTNTHKSPNRNSDSTDSLKLEMCHFKPIRSVPTTPNKRCNVIVIKTPKPKRVVLRDKNINYTIGMKGRFLSDSFLSSKESAFYLVRPPKKTLQPPFQQHKISSTSATAAIRILFRNEMLSPKTSAKMLGTKKPIVRLKRCRIDNTIERRQTNNSTTITNNSIKQVKSSKKSHLDSIVVTPRKKKSPIKRKLNGQLIVNKEETMAPPQKRVCRRKTNNNARKDLANNNPFFSATTNSVEEVSTLEKIIEEQRKCEEIIIQERIDFELAKKLAAAGTPRTRKTTRTNNSWKEVKVVRNLRKRTTRNSVKT